MFGVGKLPTFDVVVNQLDTDRGIIINSPDGRIVLARYRTGAGSPNMLTVEVLRGPMGDRKLGSLNLSDEPLWLYPRTLTEMKAYGTNMIGLIRSSSCTADHYTKARWTSAIHGYQGLLVALLENLFPDPLNVGKERVSLGAAIKYFLYCLWTRAISRKDPNYLVGGFEELKGDLIDPLLDANPRGLNIHKAAKYLGGICSNTSCGAKGWSTSLCGQCKNRPAQLAAVLLRESQYSDYLLQHQELVVGE